MQAASFSPTSEMIDAIAEWRARQMCERINRPIVPLLRERFGLSAREAITVIRDANLKGRYANVTP